MIVICVFPTYSYKIQRSDLKISKVSLSVKQNTDNLNVNHLDIRKIYETSISNTKPSLHMEHFPFRRREWLKLHVLIIRIGEYLRISQRMSYSVHGGTYDLHSKSDVFCLEYCTLLWYFIQGHFVHVMPLCVCLKRYYIFVAFFMFHRLCSTLICSFYTILLFFYKRNHLMFCFNFKIKLNSR